MKLFITKKPAFLFLLPIFFVFHGFVEHYDFVSQKDALVLLLLYSAGMLMIFGIYWLFCRDVNNAALIALFTMSFFLFFGSIQDFLRRSFAGTFFARYSFIMPLFLVLLATLAAWSKRKKASPQKTVGYFNILFLLFLFIDFVWLTGKIVNNKRHPVKSLIAKVSACDSCSKPNVFFIVLDEYSGSRALKMLFNFDNSAFEKQLEARGFFVAKQSRSNYNYTPFSIASILNMSYLHLRMEAKAPGNIDYCYRQIRNSSVINYFLSMGYDFYNYSIFDFNERPAVNYDDFLPNSTTLIHSQTFFSRVMKDISFNISTGKWKINFGLEKRTYKHLHNNENFIELTSNAALQKTIRPKFVYTHLMMPHYPYYFDSRGRSRDFQNLFAGQEANRQNYIEYLQYCNGRLLPLIDSIISVSDSPPVIMLLADHGFKEGVSKEEHKYVFPNLSAVYFPDRNYGQLYDSISNVNQFRVLLNTEFDQRLPLLSDSTIYLWDNENVR
jgi:hypothetical protein